jgi:hypothetical protein
MRLSLRYGRRVALPPALRFIAPCVLVCALGAAPSRTEEGLFPVTEAPAEAMSRLSGAARLRQWPRATLRFNTRRFSAYVGGSGAFVSGDGLILTNRHVLPLALLAQSATAGRNAPEDGYRARSLAEEIRLPDLSVDALMSTREVTQEIAAAVDGAANEADADRRRAEAITRIERAAAASAEEIAEVLSFDSGARQVLHLHRRYSDIRLVFVPERRVAQRAGDHPARAFDVALLRAYERNAPAQPSEYFTLATHRLREGAPVFVLGAPTASDRHLTEAEAIALREVETPHWREAVSLLQSLFEAHAAADAVARPRATLAFLQRVMEDRAKSLREESFLATRREAERRLHEWLAAQGDDATLAAAQTLQDLAPRVAEENFRSELLSARGLAPDGPDTPLSAAFASPLIAFGAGLLALRRDEARESRAADFERWSETAPPVEAGVETLRIEAFLQILQKTFGAENQKIGAALDDATPEKKALALVSASRLGDPAFRRALLAMDAQQFDATRDPLLDLLRLLEPLRRETETTRQRDGALFTAAKTRVRRAMALAHSDAPYPDATRSARISYGAIRGWRRGDDDIPAVIAIGDFFSVANSVDRTAPLDFTSTADALAGSSGSATLDADGALIGVVFGPGAIEGAAAAEYAYAAGAPRRAAHVAAAAIIEALTKIYDAPELARELLSGRR